MSRTRAAALSVTVVLALAPAGARAQESAQSLRGQGYEAAFNLDYSRADELFKAAIAAAPNDPAGYRGAAKTDWLRILFMNGTVTVDQYMGKMSSSDLKVPVPPEPYASDFHRNIDRAIQLAEKAVAANDRSVAAHYELGAAVGYLASYTGTIDGKLWSAMTAGRRAFQEHEKVLEMDPKRYDAGLVVGTYRYITASLPWALRPFAYVIGFHGDKDKAIQRLQEAAAYPSDAQTDANFALMLIYSREGRHEDALKVIRGLEQSYPRNRLLLLEEGSALLRAGRPAEAEKTLDVGIARMEADQRPRMKGEATHLFYKRGMARVELRKAAAAEQDLNQALADKTGPGWVRGRIHLEMGKAADLLGNRARARSEYQTAIAICEDSKDPGAAEAAKKLLDKPYR